MLYFTAYSFFSPRLSREGRARGAEARAASLSIRTPYTYYGGRVASSPASRVPRETPRAGRRARPGAGPAPAGFLIPCHALRILWNVEAGSCGLCGCASAWTARGNTLVYSIHREARRVAEIEQFLIRPYGNVFIRLTYSSTV